MKNGKGENQSVGVAHESFMESFMTLNIINFTNMAKRENNRVSWDVKRVSSLLNSYSTVT